MLQNDRIENKDLVGINLGAGNPSRNWSLEKFAKLSQILSRDDNLQVLVFFGPEEDYLQKEIKEKFSSKVIVYNKLNLPQLAAAFSYLRVLIGNDTGPLHLGAIVGAPIILVMDKNASLKYLPLSENLSLIRTETLDKISTEEVFEATQNILKNEDKLSH